MEQIEDSALIARILDGDRKAFAVLVQRYSRYVYAQIVRSVRLVDDVEDLVQIVFVKVYENLHQLRNPDRFRPWLHSIVRNAVNSHHRHRAVQLRLEETFYPEPATHDEEEIKHVVRAALRILSAEHRQVIAHHYFKGYSYAETADLLNLTVETVRGRLRRARLKLKGELHKMSDTQMQTTELDRADMDALKKVIGFVSDDEKRPILQGVCLDIGGRATATNGHIMIIRTLKSLTGLAAPIVIGPWSGTQLPEQATMKIAETTVEIQSNGTTLQVPLIEGPYVKYEQVIPQEDPAMRVSISSALLTHALDLLQNFMEARHPESDMWQYRPRVDLHLSPLTQTITFLTSRDTGYTREDNGKFQYLLDAKDDDSPRGVADWIFQVPLNAKFETSSEDTLRLNGSEERPVVHRFAVNFAYLKQILHALDFEDSDEIVLEFREQSKAIILRTPLNAEWLALLMPLRLKSKD